MSQWNESQHDERQPSRIRIRPQGRPNRRAPRGPVRGVLRRPALTPSRTPTRTRPSPAQRSCRAPSSPSPPTRSSSTSATRPRACCPAPPLTTTPTAVKPGDTFPVSVTGRNEEHYYELSRFKVAQPRDWSALEAAFAEKLAVVGTVTEVIKGGLTRRRRRPRLHARQPQRNPRRRRA